MTTVKRFLALAALCALAACSNIDTATRNATGLDPSPGATAAPANPQAALPPVSIAAFEVTVPGYLKVSEANAYIPRGDIVWRGDPIGDRYAQVRAIFEESLQRSAGTLTTGTPVVVKVTVRRFHALTEKARYTTGGVHNIVFDLAVHDAATGALLRPVKTVHADLRAFGGAKAIEADAAGQTQKVRITEHLRRTMIEELTLPGGHKNAKLGVIQAMNYSR